MGAPIFFFFLTPIFRKWGIFNLRPFSPHLFFFFGKQKSVFFCAHKAFFHFFLIFASPFFKNGRFFYPPHFAPIFFFFWDSPFFWILKKWALFLSPHFLPIFFFLPPIFLISLLLFFDIKHLHVKGDEFSIKLNAVL